MTEEKIKITKGNIRVNKKLLNKYLNIREIFSKKINIKELILISNDSDIYISNQDNISEIKKLSKEIFEKYHDKNAFINNGDTILVSRSGIDESITKIYESHLQRELIIEHLIIFANLGTIIESAKLINQVLENKGRKKYNHWNYYFNIIKIKNKLYKIEFEVVSMLNGENHYRVQRIEIK